MLVYESTFAVSSFSVDVGKFGNMYLNSVHSLRPDKSRNLSCKKICICADRIMCKIIHYSIFNFL